MDKKVGDIRQRWNLDIGVGAQKAKGAPEERVEAKIVSMVWSASMFSNPADLGGGEGVYPDEDIYGGTTHRELDVVVGRSGPAVRSSR